MTAQSELDEDRIAAVALGKTVAFLLYSLLLFPVLTGLALLTPLETMPPQVQDMILGAVFVLGALALLILIIQGALPGSSGSNAEPFSEIQLGLGCTVVSAVVWLWPGSGSEAKAIVHAVINGGLVLGVLVYFVTKSVITRRPRWVVLSVLLVPLIQLLLDSRQAPEPGVDMTIALVVEAVPLKGAWQAF